jgi:hypothetical protein
MYVSLLPWHIFTAQARLSHSWTRPAVSQAFFRFAQAAFIFSDRAFFRAAVIVLHIKTEILQLILNGSRANLSV